jgi:threonylcarbamoyladenosine tRNA methylthiotransferase MtaB
MKRRHSCSEAIAFCERIRCLRPDIVFGADLIAGFPTESEAMFANSLKLVEDCGLTFLHVFPFSSRPGTPAAKMPQIERREVKARAERLRQAGRAALDSYLATCQGRHTEVLVEKDTTGRTPHFTEIMFDKASTPGSLITASVTGYDSGRLKGTVHT